MDRATPVSESVGNSLLPRSIATKAMSSAPEIRRNGLEFRVRAEQRLLLHHDRAVGAKRGGPDFGADEVRAQGRRFLRQPDLEFDRVGRPVELEETGRADELCAAGAAGQLIALVPDDAWSFGVERGRAAGEAGERFVFAAGAEPGFGAAFMKGRAVRDAAGAAELVRHLFFGRRAGLEVDGDRCRRGRRREQQHEQRRHCPDRHPDRRASHASTIGTGGPRVSTARVPIRSPWTLGLGSIRDRRPKALGDPLDRRHGAA